MSLGVNYYVNKILVFKNKKSHYLILFKYLLLVGINFIIVYYLMDYISKQFNINIPLLKVMIESIMFIINFYIQKYIIFKKDKSL